MHLLAAFIVTTLLAAGIAGLGSLLGGRSDGDRWVRGWTALWWLVALAAQVFTPRTGVAVGFAAAAVGLVAAAARARRLTAVAGYGLGMLAGAPLWLAPPYFYDALVYHIGLPWSWLVNGSFATVPHNLFSHFPLAAQTVFLLPVAAGCPEAAAGLHWVTFVVALVELVRLAERLGAGRYRWAAPALLVACWHATWVAGVAAPDHLVVLAVLVMIDALVFPAGSARARTVSLGLGAGLAIGVKCTAVIPVAAVLTSDCIGSALVVAGAAGVGLAASSFWWIRNLASTGNPVFPLLWSVLGGGGWLPRDNDRYLAVVREGIAGFGSVPHGLAHLVVPPAGLGWWAVASLPLVVFAMSGTDAAANRRRRLGLAGALALAGWLATSQTTRYVLPLAAIVAALAAAGLGLLGRRPARWAGALLLATILHGFAGFASFVLVTLGSGPMWAGKVSREEWRHSVTVNDPLPAYRRCDALLPTEARILVIGEGRAWGCPRPHHVSSPYDRQLVQAYVEEAPSAADAVERLRSAGFTHLLINWGEVGRLGGPDFRVLRWETPDAGARWRELLSGFTTPLFREGAIEVRALLGGQP